MEHRDRGIPMGLDLASALGDPTRMLVTGERAGEAISRMIIYSSVHKTMDRSNAMGLVKRLNRLGLSIREAQDYVYGQVYTPDLFPDPRKESKGEKREQSLGEALGGGKV